MIYENKLIEDRNGWLILIGNIKYGNTPIIRRERITSFVYYASEKMGDDLNYIIFDSTGTEKRWVFDDREKLMEVYTELINFLCYKEKI